MGPLEVNFGKGECTLCLVVLVLLIPADVGRAQAPKPTDDSLVSMQREVGALRAKISSLNSWLGWLWCSGGDSKHAKYAEHQSCHYCLYRKRREFNDAFARCRMRRSDLVSIHNKAEEKFITATFGGSYWIGARDHFVEGDWQWTDGSPFRFSSWMAGEPTNNVTHGKENCVAGFGAGWADDPCTMKRSYICKICPWPPVIAALVMFPLSFLDFSFSLYPFFHFFRISQATASQSSADGQLQFAKSISTATKPVHP